MTEEKTKVKAAKVRHDQFEMELVSNGKVEAKEKATLNFLVTDIIDSVFVSNGSRVRRGDPIALVDGYNASQQLRDAWLNMEKITEPVNERRDK